MSRYGSQETQRNFLSSSKSGKMEVGSSVKKANNFFIDQSINWIRLTRATENRGLLGAVPLCLQCYRVLEIAPSAKYTHFWKANVPSSSYDTACFPLFTGFEFNRGDLNNSGNINSSLFELVMPGPRKNTIVNVFTHFFPLALEHTVFCRMTAEMQNKWPTATAARTNGVTPEMMKMVAVTQPCCHMDVPSSWLGCQL